MVQCRQTSFVSDAEPVNVCPNNEHLSHSVGKVTVTDLCAPGLQQPRSV